MAAKVFEICSFQGGYRWRCDLPYPATYLRKSSGDGGRRPHNGRAANGSQKFVHDAQVFPPQSAARVVDTSLVGFNHLHKKLDHAGRRVELSATLTFGGGKTAQEILIHPPKDILVLP